MKLGEMLLKYTTTECRRCAGTRILREPCPECGLSPEPHEVQPDLERRRRAVEQFRAERRAAHTAVLTADEALAQVTHSVDRVLRQLSRVASGSGQATDLVRVFGDLDDHVAALEVLRPRPYRNVGRARARASASVRDGLDVFVDAMAAPTPLAAQELQRRGQRLLDAGSAILDRSQRERRAWAEAVDVPTAHIAGALGLSARRAAGGDGLDLTSLDARLQRVYDAQAPDPARVWAAAACAPRRACRRAGRR